MPEIMVGFVNGRTNRFPADLVRFARLGQHVDEEYKPDIARGGIVVNWDNVCFVMEWREPEDIDP